MYCVKSSATDEIGERGFTAFLFFFKNSLPQIHQGLELEEPP